MATKRESSDISQLQKDVSAIQTDIKYIVKSQDVLTKKIDSLQYPSIIEFRELKDRVKDLEIYNDSNRVGTMFSNIFASKAFTFVIGLIFAAIIYYVVRTGDR